MASIRVLVAVEGGIVQGAVADVPGVEVIVIDYDGEEQLRRIPQGGGETSLATLDIITPVVDPDFIDGAENAEELP